MNSTHADLQVMKHAEHTGDVAQLQSSAHRIKGTAPMVGARRMAQLVAAVDRDAKQGSLALWLETKDDITQAWNGFLDAVGENFAIESSEIDSFRDI